MRLNLGISYFDTSPLYGIGGPDGKWISQGESQRIVGEGLEGTSKPHLLATKIGAWQRHNHTVEDCLAEVRDNLRILRRDRVDVLLGHDMEQRRFWKPDAKEGEQLEIDESLDYEHAPVMQALREAQAQGLCRYLGLSSNRSEPLAHVMQQLKLDMCLSANEYSLMDRRSPRVMLPVIREQGAAYVIGGIFSVPGRGVVNGALFRDERLLELAPNDRYLYCGAECALLAGESGDYDHPGGCVHTRGARGKCRGGAGRSTPAGYSANSGGARLVTAPT